MPSDIPNIQFGAQADYRRLYYSDPDSALKVPVTIQAGYGVLKSGTALAKNASAAGNKGKMVPYNPTSFTGAAVHPGRAYLVTDSGTTQTSVYVTIDDSYKFAVGDDLIIHDNTTAARNLGAITAIDRTSEVHRARITFTTNTGATSYTTARKAHVLVEAGDSTNSYSDCVGVLEKSVDTGSGNGSAGAVAMLIVSNATLYAGCLSNVDAAAKTDISASDFGQYLILK
jgi:hypothetical protein